MTIETVVGRLKFLMKSQPQVAIVYENILPGCTKEPWENCAFETVFSKLKPCTLNLGMIVENKTELKR